jgi:hypothetical protein
MKAKLIFELPEEQYEYDLANNASSMHSVLWDFEQWLRRQIKHGELTDEKYEAYQECRNKFYELLTENNVDLS